MVIVHVSLDAELFNSVDSYSGDSHEMACHQVVQPEVRDNVVAFKVSQD